MIVLVHGGHEYQNLPSPYYVDLLRFYASLGVSAVIGHHTHCISLMEMFRDVPICYGLGNFVFPWSERKSKAWYEGIAISLDIIDGNATVRVVPFRQDLKGKVSYLEDEIIGFEESEFFVDEGYFESDEYVLQIEAYLRSKGKAAFLNLAVPNRLMRGLVKHGFIPEQKVLGNRFISYYHNFQCEGSVEATKAYIESVIKMFRH